MISTACYPYPVNDKSTARRAVLQPHIYSPSESHSSPKTMYPHFHSSGSPSPNYFYSGYEQYYAKDSWASATPSSWSTLYPRSSALVDTVHPKVTIHPPQPVLVSDIDTPSSISSHALLTPPSPFAQHDVEEMDFQSMDSCDEFDCDDDEDYIDSDFADEMEGVDETEQEHSLVYGASAPHVIKSTSALEGALGDIPSSSSYDTSLGVFAPADRRLSASVPGYPSASHRSTVTAHSRLTSSPPVPEPSYPSQHTDTHRNHSSLTSLTAHTSPSLYNHMPPSSSSLAGAFAASTPSTHASRPIVNILPILQPQPIRPIPPIPLADLTSSANDRSSPDPCAPPSHPSLRMLSPLPLLCQPVSDAVRYQLKKSPSSGALNDICFEDESTSDLMCEDLVTVSGNHRFTQGLAFCPEHLSTAGSCSVGERMYSCGRGDLPIRWQ